MTWKELPRKARRKLPPTSTLDEKFRVESRIKTNLKRRVAPIEKAGYRIMGKMKYEDYGNLVSLESATRSLEELAEIIHNDGIPFNKHLILVPVIESSTQPQIYTDGLFHPTFEIFKGRYLVYYKG